MATLQHLHFVILGLCLITEDWIELVRIPLSVAGLPIERQVLFY